TNQAHEIFEAGKSLLKLECGRAKFRLIGIGLSRLVEAADVSQAALDATFAARSRSEAAMDKIRDKFGNAAVDLGIGFKKA
ncbi:MAG: DNA polymerase IV, partial [Aestuariivirga sp.]